LPTLRIHFKDVPELEELSEKLFRFNAEKEGKYLDISFPDSEPPLDVPQDLIECVTLREGEILGYLRRQGVYKRDGSRLVLETHQYTKGGYFQNMEGSGPTIASLMELYSLVRQGKLWPEEDWEAPQSAPPRVNLKGPLNSFWMTIRSFFRNLSGKIRTPELPRRK
jgi:hypothetical protein